MRVEDACELLARHNEWRRGADTDMESPALLGLAIDTVVAAAKESDRLRDAIKKTLDENGHLADGENCTLIVLKRALGIQQCKKCGADMQPGVAMAQTFTGSPDFIGGEVCTVSPGGPGKLIECSKCPECGWSTTC